MRYLGLLAAVLIVAACGQTRPVASLTPTAGNNTPSASASPSASPSATTSATATPSASPSTAPPPSPAPVAANLVIQDPSKNQVRIAKLNAVDVAAITGSYDGVVSGQVIVVNGTSLLAVSRTGSVRTLGHLAGTPEWTGPGTVAVNPTLSQWFYTIVDFTNLSSKIHLAGASSDRVVATIASPDGTSFYQPFAWSPSGTYMVREGTGLGGVGPFLEYHFPLAKVDLSAGTVTDVSPTCVAESVLDDGTMLCRTTTGAVEVRPANGPSHTIQIGTATSGGNAIYGRLTLSPNRQRFAASRNGNSNPNLVNYQVAIGALSGTSAVKFGPIDFYPDVWLPDGRLVADHLCWSFQGDGGPCNAALNGTYFISADGKTETLFFKLAQGVSVVAAV